MPWSMKKQISMEIIWGSYIIIHKVLIRNNIFMGPPYQYCNLVYVTCLIFLETAPGLGYILGSMMPFDNMAVSKHISTEVMFSGVLDGN